MTDTDIDIGDDLTPEDESTYAVVTDVTDEELADFEKANPYDPETEGVADATEGGEWL